MTFNYLFKARDKPSSDICGTDVLFKKFKDPSKHWVVVVFFFWYVTFSKYINWNVKYDNIIYFIQSQLNSKNNYPRLTMSLEIVSLVLENTFMIFRISGSIKSVLYKSRLYNMFGGGYVVWICQLISSKWEMGRREIPMTQFGFKWSKYNSFHIHTAWFLV